MGDDEDHFLLICATQPWSTQIIGPTSASDFDKTIAGTHAYCLCGTNTFDDEPSIVRFFYTGETI